jgi:hypothetical protein
LVVAGSASRPLLTSCPILPVLEKVDLASLLKHTNLILESTIDSSQTYGLIAELVAAGAGYVICAISGEIFTSVRLRPHPARAGSPSFAKGYQTGGRRTIGPGYNGRVGADGDFGGPDVVEVGTAAADFCNKISHPTAFR